VRIYRAGVMILFCRSRFQAAGRIEIVIAFDGSANNSNLPAMSFYGNAALRSQLE
jgi:hypothetical protein